MRVYWEKKKEKLRQRFSGITNKDLRYRVGREVDMLKKLKNKLGKTDEEILKIIIDL